MHSPDVLRHIRPRSICIIGGVFLFLFELSGNTGRLGFPMDRVEAKRNIEKYEAEITKWQALSRGLMSRDEMIMVDRKIALLKERSKNLRNMLNA